MTRAWLVVVVAACGEVVPPDDGILGEAEIGIGVSHDPTWVTHLGGPGDDEAIAVAVAPSGVYVAGHTASSWFRTFTDPCAPGLGGHAGEDCADAFVANVTSGDGVQFGGAQSDEVKFLATTEDAIYACGNEREGAAGNFQKDGYVTRFPLDLSAAAWSVTIRNANRVDEFMGVATHGADVYAAGGSNAPVDGHAIAQEDHVVTRLTHGGATAALDQFGGAGLDELMGIAADTNGPYTIGASADWIDDDPGAPLGSTDVIVVAHAPSLDPAAERCRVQFGSRGKDVGQSIVVAGDHIYVAGYTEGELNGACNLDREAPDGARMDAFIAKYDTSCRHVWTRQFGTTDSDAANTIALFGDRLYISGYYGSTDAAHDGTTNAHGFVRAYDLDGNVLGEVRFDSHVHDIAHAVAADADQVYVAGGTRGVLGTSPALGDRDAFLATIPRAALEGNVTFTGASCHR